MKRGAFLVAFLLVSLPPALAQSQQPGAGSGHALVNCFSRELAAISGVITASEITICLATPEIVRTATSTFVLTFNVQGPDVPTGGVATFTPSTVSAVGCSVAAWTTISEVLSAGTGGTSYTTATMSSGECKILAKFVVSAAVVPVVLATMVFPINVAIPYIQNDNLDRLCNASDYTTACTTPTVNVDVVDDTTGDGMLTVPIATAVALSGSLTVDVADDTTSDGALTVAGSLTSTGSSTISITSWPALTATLAGGLTITDDGNGWIIHQDALTGTINVVNSGGQTVAVSSWPELLATIDADVAVSGTLTLDGDLGVDILDDTTDDAFLTIPTSTIDVNATFNNATFQDNSIPVDWNWWLELIFVVGTMLACFVMGWWFMAAFPIIIFPHLLVPTWPFDMKWALPFLFLGIILEWVSQRWRLKKAQSPRVM